MRAYARRRSSASCARPSRWCRRTRRACRAHRVDEARIEALLGEPLARASPDFVRSATGYAIGGIPPLGHARSMTTFVDESLLGYERIWAAAGHPNALFELASRELPAM